MNEIEKRMNAAVDILTWLDQRIMAQVEHQVEKRLAQEREYWRINVTDLITEERERLAALVAEERRSMMESIKTDIVGLVERDHERSQRMFAKVNEVVEGMFDRLEEVIGTRLRSDADPPPSKH